MTGAAVLVASSPAPAAVTFNFSDDGTLSTQALAGFQDAANIWSSVLTDNVTINVSLSWQALSPGVIGSASSNFVTYSYSAVRSAMIADATSDDDATVAANLPAASAIGVYINRTSDNPNGAGSATPYLDDDGGANNTNVRMTRANAKALGLLSANDANEDVAITFSSNFPFDFDSSDGIDPGKMDFVAVAVHEIGHSLGFTSGVDILDLNSSGPYYNDNAFTYISVADLFRFSEDSAALGVIDWTADTRQKLFSMDWGQTYVDGLSFSTGRNWGDGQQNSHWKDSLGIGLLDPTIAYGEHGTLTDNDKRALDVFGWDLASTLPAATLSNFSGGGGGGGAAPEPEFLLIVGVGAAVLRLTGRHREGRAP